MDAFFDLSSRIQEREPLLAEVASLFEPNERVLDIATGSGYLVRQMKPQEVVCVDIDPQVLEKTSKLLPGTYLCADATRLPFSDSSFDSAVAWTGVAHIPDWRGLFREMARVTKKGGKLMTAEPRGEYATRAFRDSRCTHPMPPIEEMVGEMESYGKVDLIEKDYFTILIARLL